MGIRKPICLILGIGGSNLALYTRYTTVIMGLSLVITANKRMAKVSLYQVQDSLPGPFISYAEHHGLYNWYRKAPWALYWASGRIGSKSGLKSGTKWSTWTGRPFIGYDDHTGRKPHGLMSGTRRSNQAVYHIHGSHHGPFTSYDGHASSFIWCWKASWALYRTQEIFLGLVLDTRRHHGLSSVLNDHPGP